MTETGHLEESAVALLLAARSWIGVVYEEFRGLGFCGFRVYQFMALAFITLNASLVRTEVRAYDG